MLFIIEINNSVDQLRHFLLKKYDLIVVNLFIVIR